MFYKVKGISPKSGKGTVSILYRQPGLESLFSTGVTVRPKDFDTKTGKVHKRVAEHPELNAQIQQKYSDIETAVRDARTRHGVVTKQNLNDELHRQQVKKQAIEIMQPVLEGQIEKHLQGIRDLEAEVVRQKQEFDKGIGDLAKFKYYDYKQKRNITTLTDKIADYISLNPEHRRAKTVEGYQDTLDNLKEFNADITIGDVNLKFFQEFQSFLVGKGMRNGSVRTYMDRFKKLYKTLADDESIAYPFLKRFSLIEDLADENIITLTSEEIAAIEALPLRLLRQRQIRAQFLFSCEVALRHSDLYITSTNIKADTLHLVTKKGKCTVKPPITDKARAILESEFFPFHRVGINQYNKTIKAICRKIPSFHIQEVFTHFVDNNPVEEVLTRWECVSSHVGRYTAINNWLRQGVRESVVAKWAGHKDLKMLMKHYQDYEAATAQEQLKLR